MGVGSYSEQDVKEASRAFTGWTIGNAKYMISRAMADQDRPYGRIAMHFEYHPEDHDDGEKEFLGRKGRFDGEGIVDIICEQEATARFISRHMYSFFVADEPPVPEWPHTPPRDPQAIEALSQAYFDSGYSIRAMLRVLFNSDFFKSEDVWYERVKGPAELMARRSPPDERVRSSATAFRPYGPFDHVHGPEPPQPGIGRGLALGYGVDRFGVFG